MVRVIGISFKDTNKIYYFDPKDFLLKKDDLVVVETERGLQLAYVSSDIYEVDEQKLNFPVKPILRVATEEDKTSYLKNEKEADKALKDTNRIIKELKLNMKVINVNFTLDKKQLLITFTADERVDFRELAVKLSKIYKTRIELRQIGVRDKAKNIGGLGQCGRSLCCSTFLNDINSVSINMAKNQELALNPQKINGSCGRLMCCLNYENELYTDLKQGLPKVGSKVKTVKGIGKVISIDVFKRRYSVELENKEVVVEDCHGSTK